MQKIIIKYLIMYMAFVLGIVLFSVGVMNLFSSLLLFVGGYMSIKNTLDYRLIKRNINEFKRDRNVEMNVSSNINVEDNILSVNNVSEKEMVSSIKSINHNVENIMGIKRIRRYGRVRRKY